MENVMEKGIKRMEKEIKRGDVLYADLAVGVGSEQIGYRPVLVIQNDTGNKHSHTVIVAVLTSRMSYRTKIPTHCHISAQDGLTQDSIVLLEQLRTVDKIRLGGHVCTLDDETMQRVDHALAISVGLEVISCRKE